MNNRIIFGLAAGGLLFALASAYIYGQQKPALPPVFSPPTNPYASGIYTNGIVESYQGSGENINLYPEVAGRVAAIYVQEGDQVKAGQALALIDDSVQQALVQQQRHQADAALAQWQALQAQPRKETLDLAAAQVAQGRAGVKTARDAYEKQLNSYRIDARSVSKDALDSALDALQSAQANLDYARRQYALTKAGAWVYDIRNQQAQYEALEQAYQSSSALLRKFTLRAPADGVVLALNTARGSYVSPQGAYDTYTQGYGPVAVMGEPQSYLSVRCFIDEILVSRLPAAGHIRAQMSLRGTNLKIPLEFVRLQPYVTPKIQLSDQRLERVDLRVLPVIFRFRNPGNVTIYPGQQVDVYVGEK